MSRSEEIAARIAFRGLVVAAEVTLAPQLRPEAGQRSSLGRQAALYLLVTGANVPGALAARVYGCSKQYVSKTLSEIEDRRDDPVFGAGLDRLEQMIFGDG